uniref:ATP synthase FO subunit 8 n=1 Tax=Telenomus dignus TaxID=1738631 RepID=A0A342I4C9_9HYME|nr:ATP synthase FO subunit 8 [Telenomus dignus]
MPQMSPTWWTILFLFNITLFIIINMIIYFKWMPFDYNKFINMKKWNNFLLNDKNF